MLRYDTIQMRPCQHCMLYDAVLTMPHQALLAAAGPRPHLFLEDLHVGADLLQEQLHLYELRMRVRQVPYTQVLSLCTHHRESLSA